MFALLFALSPFLILLAFIAWDKRRHVTEKIEPMSREALRSGWKAKPVSNAPMFIGLALVFLSLGVVQWFSPDVPPYRGGLSWVYEIVYTYLGLQGQAYVFWIFAVLLVFVSFISRRVES